MASHHVGFVYLPDGGILHFCLLSLQLPVCFGPGVPCLSFPSAPLSAPLQGNSHYRPGPRI